MNSQDLKSKISNLSIWKKGDQRAPHKPLLILYALGRLQRSRSRFIPYEEARADLKKLLIDFGPIRKSYHPEQPFVRLTNDGIWELSEVISPGHFNERHIRKKGFSGGFIKEVYDLLLHHPNLIQEIAETILNDHFPESIHEDILEATGLDFSVIKKRIRDPRFRERILRAYSYSCAICGFNVRLGSTLVGVEAAHIKWHQAGGPDQEENGLALCSLHHKLFDRGVFTISENRRIIVSQDAHGSTGFTEFLMQYHDKNLRNPIETVYEPKTIYLNWHIREVFRGPSYSVH